MAEPEPFVALGLSLLAAQDVLEAVLHEVDAAALCQLKTVSTAWCTHARRELCTRLCRYNPRSLKASLLGPAEGGAAIAEGLKGNSTLQSLK